MGKAFVATPPVVETLEPFLTAVGRGLSFLKVWSSRDGAAEINFLG
jgi:hypothetical protein